MTAMNAVSWKRFGERWTRSSSSMRSIIPPPIQLRSMPDAATAEPAARSAAALRGQYKIPPDKTNATLPKQNRNG